MSYQTLKRVLVALALVCVPLQLRADIVIEGLPPEIADVVRANLSLTDNCEVSRWQVRYRYRNARQEIESTLATFGFYAPGVHSELSFGDDCWQARFRVDPGDPVTIETLDVSFRGEGAGFAPLTGLVGESSLQVGAVFDHLAWERLKRELGDAAARYGYLEATMVVHEVEVRPVERKASVTLTYDTGRQFRFGEVTFDTDQIMTEVLVRHIPFETGDPFETELIGELYQALLGSGYFEEVIIDTSQVDRDAAVVPVNVRPVTGETSNTSVGVGYSTDLGPKVFIRRNSRLVNRRGHQLNLDVTASPVSREIGGYYRIPQSNREAGWLSLYGGFLSEDTDTSETSRSTLGLRQIIPRGRGWIETRFLELFNEQFEVGGQSRSNLSLMPGINFAHTRSEGDVGRPTSGHRVELEVTGASSALLSTVDFASARVSGKIVQGLSTNVRFLGRARVGVTMSDDFTKLPPTVRFFSGGDERVRGFDFEQIGARDQLGNVIGGDRLLELSAEVDWRFREHWAAAVFVDAGSVSLGAFSSSFERSAGVGVRWYSPIGPLRFDIAKPLDSSDASVRLHISLGPDL